MTEKDKGLKEAIRKQPTYRIPTNFTYRMMQQINEEIYRKEKQQEKRLFILMVILCVLMADGRRPVRLAHLAIQTGLPSYR